MTKTAQLSINALKTVNLFASTESARYYLNGVLVTVTTRSALYVATDGHRMLAHREDMAEGAEPNTLTGSWIIPSESIAAVKGGTGRFSTAALLSDLGDGRLSLEGPKGAVIVKPIDGTFPDFHRVLPRAMTEKDKPGHNQFNLLYGASFAKAAELLGYSAVSPHFHQTEVGSPIPVTFGSDRTTLGVLMPVRGSDDPYEGAPAWLSMDAAQPEQQAAE